MVNQVVGLEFVVSGDNEALSAIGRVDQAQSSLGARLVKGAAIAQRYEAQHRKIDRAFNTGAISLKQHGAASNYLTKKIEEAYRGNIQLEGSMNRISAASTRSAGSLVASANAMNQFGVKSAYAGRNANRFGLYTQQVGYQVGDFFVQVQSGTDALVAFGQQGTQLAGLLPGIAGAILAIGLSLGTALLRARMESEGLSFDFQQMKDDLANSVAPLSPMFGVISDSLSYMGDVVSNVGQMFLDNLGRVVAVATAAAILFSGKLVAGIVAARFATFSLAGALTVLRGALIRTGIGAIIVGFGELIYRFNLLVKGAGSFGNAMSLLRNLVVEVVGRISDAFHSMQARTRQVWEKIKEFAIKSLVSVVDGAVGMANNVLNTFQGLVAAIKVVWGVLPSALGDVFYQAINGIIRIASDGVTKMVSGLNKFLDLLTAAREIISGGPVDEWTIDPFGGFEGITNPYAGAAANVGADAAAAFNAAFENDLLSSPDMSALRDAASRAASTAELAGTLAGAFEQSALRPLASWEAIADAIRQADEAGRSIDISKWFSGASTEDSGSGASGTARSATEVLTELQERVQSISNTIESSMTDAFMSMVDGTKSATNAFRDMARTIISELYKVLVVQRLVGSFDAKTGTGSGIVGFLSSAITGGFNANGNAFSGGNVIPFANGGVVGSPTTFPMAGGRTGLMGEAGPEAIMPLKRGSDGKLGVVAQGGGNVTVVQNFNIAANGDESVKRIVRAETPRMAEAAKAAVLDSKRRGGAYGRSF